MNLIFAVVLLLMLMLLLSLLMVMVMTTTGDLLIVLDIGHRTFSKPS